MQITTNAFKVKQALSRIAKEHPKKLNSVLTTVSIAIKKQAKTALKRNEVGLTELNPLTLKFRKRRKSKIRGYGGKLNSGITSFAKNGVAKIEWTKGLAKSGTVYGKNFSRRRSSMEVHQMFRLGLIKKYKNKARTEAAIKAVRKYKHPKRIFWDKFINDRKLDKYIYHVIKRRLEVMIQKETSGVR